MSLSEFRYNKKRKHYSYLFKAFGSRRKNIVLTTKPYRVEHNKLKKNVELYKHPNNNSDKKVYVVPIIYNDDESSFDSKRLNWSFDQNDKRRIKRIKKYHKV